MLNPITKKKFCSSIYENTTYEKDAYDQNPKFSVHLPVEEDTYLQKLEKMANDKFPTKAQAAQTRQQFEVADQKFQQQQQQQKQASTQQPKRLNTDPDQPKVKLPQISRKSQPWTRRPKRFGRTMSERMRPLGAWYYEKYTVKPGMTLYNNSFLKDKLYYDNRTQNIPKTIIKNKYIEDILREERAVLANNLLRTQLMYLKKMDLLKMRTVHKIKHAGMKKREYVYNDEHQKKTNPGYRRIFGGTYYK